MLGLRGIRRYRKNTNFYKEQIDVGSHECPTSRREMADKENNVDFLVVI